MEHIPVGERMLARMLARNIDAYQLHSEFTITPNTLIICVVYQNQRQIDRHARFREVGLACTDSRWGGLPFWVFFWATLEDKV